MDLSLFGCPFWFPAHKFHLDWPTLSAAPGIAPVKSSKKYRSATARALAAGSSPSPSPSASPSPSPAPCEISGPDIVCTGVDATFFVDFEGTGNPQWDSDGGDPNSDSGDQTKVMWFHSGEKTMSVTCPYPDGDKTSTKSVTVVEIEKLEASPAKACIGGDISVDAIPSPDSDYPEGSPTWKFTLKPEDSEIEDPPAGERTVTVTPDVFGDYILQAQCGDSVKEVSLTAIAIRLMIAEPSSACIGTSIKVFAVPHEDQDFPEGSPIWSFTAQPAGSNLPDPPAGDNPASFTPTVPGDYTLEATCADTTGEASVTVVAVKELQASDTTVCMGSDIEVEAISDPEDTDYPEGSPIWAFTQKPDGSAIQDPPAGDRIVTVTPDVPGYYTLQATCADSQKSIDLTAVGVDRIVDGDDEEGEGVCLVGQTIQLWPIPDPSDADYPAGSPKWTLLQKPTGSTATAPSDGANPAQFTPDLPGTFKLKAACGDSSAEFILHVCKARIQRDGHDLTADDTKVQIGELLVLSVEADACNVTDLQWTIPGTIFRSYFPTDLPTGYTGVTDADLKDNPVLFAWAKNGTPNVSVTFKLTGQQKTFSLQQVFTVETPTITPQPGGKPVFESDITISNDQSQIGLLTPPGILFSGKVTAPAGKTGEWCFAQTYTDQLLRKTFANTCWTYKNSGILVLDFSFPYDGPFSANNDANTTHDSPSDGLTENGETQSNTVNFTMYIMYRGTSAGKTFYWVPIYSADWNISYEAKQEDLVWAILDSDKKSFAWKADSTFPIWTKIGLGNTVQIVCP